MVTRFMFNYLQVMVKGQHIEESRTCCNHNGNEVRTTNIIAFINLDNGNPRTVESILIPFSHILYTVVHLLEKITKFTAAWR